MAGEPHARRHRPDDGRAIPVSDCKTLPYQYQDGHYADVRHGLDPEREPGSKGGDGGTGHDGAHRPGDPLPRQS